MSALRVYLDGIGLCGPGMAGWAASRDSLAGTRPVELSPTVLPAAEALPPAERRRVGVPIKLSMAIGFEAAQQAGVDPANLAAVFSSTGGDCDNCHAILETLASDDRQISPTRFHNSVHNAPSGYWSIATHCMAPSTSLCALDATFGAGLLEAASQALASGQPCLLLAYDTAYPDPLYSLRPIPYPFGLALLLRPARSTTSLACLNIGLSEKAPDRCTDATLESLRQSIPVARALPLLQRLARNAPGRVVIDYLEHLSLAIEVTA
ncbi:beta-ketoacyl synthase chain length factor [Uliginosibacterium sp. 31-16]|uniref:beta-ketoacyl synthase chain length factor n=1 Tax=Uliginosibacterium sp. 31-16 TaxID=3068315 RepID=UPI00273EF071|nr:beta-ketoacyl synthase chain length factor [Uliginosibacterium sp. 31-16]MDP5239232.1 beta-ketoacyl synthase chain length factor [Uliginosibacterium sp. 31-16]